MKKAISVLVTLLVALMPMVFAASGPSGSSVESTVGDGTATGTLASPTLTALSTDGSVYAKDVALDIGVVAAETITLTYTNGAGVTAQTQDLILAGSESGRVFFGVTDGIRAIEGVGSPTTTGNLFFTEVTEKELAATVDSVTAAGGEISEIALNTEVQTKNWQGYVGTVTGTVRLADASGNDLFTWATVSSPGAGSSVYFTTSNLVSTVVSATNDLSADDLLEADTSIYGFGASSTDSFTNTYDITGGVAGIEAVELGQTGGTFNDVNAKSTVAPDSLANVNELVFVQGLVQDQAGYDGDNYDFQVIVPYKSGVATTYFVYVDLA